METTKRCPECEGDGILLGKRCDACGGSGLLVDDPYGNTPSFRLGTATEIIRGLLRGHTTKERAAEFVASEDRRLGIRG